MVFCTGTTAEPESGVGPSSGLVTAGVMFTVVASVVAHVIVVVWPPPTVVGAALNCVICGGAGGWTCTVTVCGWLSPPFPLATAVYVVVCVGESLTLPATCGTVATVRGADVPAAAVMVTEVAFVLCHARLTLCPAMIVLGVAERVTVGRPPPLSPLQPLSPKKASGSNPQKIQRTRFVLMVLNTAPNAPDIRCRSRASLLVVRK